MLDELNLIVDCGGKVEDVFVYHKLYGVIRVEMNIKSRMDAKRYVDGIKGGVSVPLNKSPQNTITIHKMYNRVSCVRIKFNTVCVVISYNISCKFNN